MGCQQAWVEAGAARNATCRARILVASRTSAANELARLEAVARDRARFCARRAEDAENRLRATTALVFARTEELARRVAAAEAKARAATMTIEDGTSSAGQLTCRDLTRRAAVIRAEAERAGAKLQQRLPRAEADAEEAHRLATAAQSKAATLARLAAEAQRELVSAQMEVMKLSDTEERAHAAAAGSASASLDRVKARRSSVKSTAAKAAAICKAQALATAEGSSLAVARARASARGAEEVQRECAAADKNEHDTHADAQRLEAMMQRASSEPYEPFHAEAKGFGGTKPLIEHSPSGEQQAGYRMVEATPLTLEQMCA